MAASPVVVFFALLAAILLSLSQVVSKRGIEAGGNSSLAAVTAIGISGLIYWMIVVAIHGLRNPLGGLDLTYIGIFLLGGVVGTAVGRLSIYAGIDRVGASITAPVVNTRPALSAVMAVGFLAEEVTISMAIGILLLTLGIIVLSRSRGGDIGGWKRWELVFPLLAAFAFSSGSVIRRYGFIVSSADPIQAATLNETAALAVVFFYLLTRYRGDIGRVFHIPFKAYGFFLASGILVAMGILSTFYALSQGPVVIVDPITATLPLFTTLFAYLFLKDIERVTPRLIVGIILVVIGAAMVTLA